VVTDAQVRKLMNELKQGAGIGVASLRAGMHRNTARRYVAAGGLPSELKTERRWRTRKDPFAADWPAITARLESAPELESKALFEDLMARHPDRYHEGQLRTFQRHVKQWRATEGPEKEVFFGQNHRPGEALQTDFTCCKKLEVTIGGEVFHHLLCHTVLPYSNWQSATVSLSESMLAIRQGVQTAVFRLGRVPRYHQTDNSTAATHDLKTGRRGFNDEYVSVMEHLGMKPRTIGIGQSHQNGDIEAANGALKRRLEQHLLLRGSRDFESVELYQAWVSERLEQANGLRAKRLREELAIMRLLQADRLPQHRRLRVRVSSCSTIRVKNNTYSVPSRLIGEQVVVLLREMTLEVLYGGLKQLCIERLRGHGKHRVNYRHVIASLVRKPGAFARYRFRDAMFPTLVFRRAYDALSEGLSQRQADLDYLRILKLAATTMQCEVEAALELIEAEQKLPRFEAVEALTRLATPQIPKMEPLVADLATYDQLLTSSEEAVQ